MIWSFQPILATQETLNFHMDKAKKKIKIADSKKPSYSIPPIELLNNKSHGLSPPGGFSSLFFDQAVPYYSQRHLHLHQ
jgi:hypothetical protein